MSNSVQTKNKIKSLLLVLESKSSNEANIIFCIVGMEVMFEDSNMHNKMISQYMSDVCILLQSI